MAIKALDLVSAFRIPLEEKWGYIWGKRGQVWTQANQNAATREMTVKYGQKWVGRKVADCSGMFVWAYKRFGASIYHGSDTIWRKYTSMTGRVEGTLSIRPGTAVFMESGGKRGHVGIYIGGGKCIEAQGTRTGIVVVNMGDSGTGYKAEEQSNVAFYQRIANVPTNADVVTIFGSGNDMRYQLGNPTDTGTDTLCGCINTTIDNLIAVMPTVALGIVSPTPWDEYPSSDTDNPMALYVAAMKTICEYRSIPFLDLYHCSGLRPWTEEGRAACYTKDDGNGVHPDEKGHALIAPRFKAFLEMLIL